MPFISTRTCERLYYSDTGAGPPVVFIHGWSYSGVVWRQHPDCIPEGYRCLCVDLPGHGQSSSALHGYTLESLADTLCGFFNQLDLNNGIIVGWSLGALIAMVSSLHMRNRIRALVLVAGTAKFTLAEGYPCGLAANEVKGLSLRLRRNKQVTLENFFLSMFSHGDLQTLPKSLNYETLVAGRFPETEALLGTLDVLSSTDVRDLLPGFTLPVLVVHGEDDRICPPGAGQYLAQGIAAARLVLIPGCGHALFLSRPEEFMAALTDFLGNVYGIDR